MATRRGLRRRGYRRRIRRYLSWSNSRRSCEGAGARSTRTFGSTTRRGYGGWRTTCAGQRRRGRVLGLWQGRKRRGGGSARGVAEREGGSERLRTCVTGHSIEDGCLGCVRQVLQAEGWQARSWQQEHGLLVEDEGGRRLRGGGGGGEAKARLEIAMRKAETEVMRAHCMEVSLLIKSFFEAPVEAVLQRMAGAGGRRPSVAQWRRREK
jgi:hypothetical protein